jgi:hypothetical protein
VTGSIDVFNLFNSSAVLSESGQYSAFRTPGRVVGGRLIKFSGSIAF